MSDRIQVSVANQQTRYAVDEAQLVEAARAVLRQSRFLSAEISLAVVDDPTIHKLNRRYLDHDWPTDVLSFKLDDSGSHLAGEVVVSADTAVAMAPKFGWPAAAELLLYVIHGMLHLVGYRDKSSVDAREMQAAEQALLREFGFDASGKQRKTRPVTTSGRQRSHVGAMRR
jgi:probable rRNA maturation factor